MHEGADTVKQKIIRRILLSFAALFVLQTAGFIKTQAENPGDSSSVWWWTKEKEELPPLKGGPEEEVRELNPVSNVVLQQEYPDFVFVKGPDTANRVALTFDDGPDPDFSPLVLDVLKEYNVPATFFLMGVRSGVYPDLVRRMAEEGHEIGNHTYWHPDLVEEGDVDILVDEVNRTEDVLEDILGFRTSLFRAPYGFLYRELVEELVDLNYSVIAWDVDSLDWQMITEEEIAENVLSQVEPGSIILMHDGGGPGADRTETVDSLRIIIPELLAQGYEFVTVSELLNIPAVRE
ncbi:polysaccharide deacetylase family protein [Alteribacter keqinensis]|uniref:Polysaccharide deacetylase family protein n=1 Tax=Alteribacter keqinensis TaxID=2483800 RepID=A0A3M7TYA4_9BACI|nr:polysaccharide deacetylase family protein [Alteribacter keqinensis]